MRLFQNLRKLISHQVLFNFFTVMFFILLSQTVIQTFNQSEDIFFFTKWDLFGDPPEKAFDISCKENEKYLLRDFTSAVRAKNIDTVSLFHTIRRRNFDLINKLYYSQITEILSCKELVVVKVDGTIYDHFVLKKPVQITEKFELR